MSDEAAAAAAEVAGTEAPAPSNGAEPTDKLFESIAGELGVSAPEPEPEKPAAETKDDKAEPDEPDAAPEFDDLSDERPWTPERIKNAAQMLRADKRKIGGMLSQLTKRETKLRAKVEQVRTEKRQMDLITTRVMNDLETVRAGTAEQAAAALGRLAQTDPYAFYEKMSLAFLGKAPQQAKESAHTKALEEKIARLEAKLEHGEQAQTEQQTIAQAQRQLVRVLQSENEWPILAAKAAEAPQEVAAELWELYESESRRAKRWLDAETFADRIERKLRLQMPSHRAKQNGAAGSGPGREQETRAQGANPGMAQSPPRSLSPSQAGVAGASRRPTSEEELQAELVRSGPDDPFFQQFSF